MKKQALVIAMLAIGLTTFACKKDEAAGGGGGGAGGDSVGVQECDDYIKKYATCIDKMPAAAKPAAEQGFKAQKDAWKTSAATPEGKAALKTGCKAALDALAGNPMCK